MIRRIPRVVRAGLVAGIVSVYLCLVGIVGSLVTDVVGRITVGRVVLSIPAILRGSWSHARGSSPARSAGRACGPACPPAPSSV